MREHSGRWGDTFCALVLLLLGSQLFGALDEKDARPNFVIVIADDMAWDDAGAYGHPSIRTPNIDRLAREGERFDRAFLTTSSCSPSRCSILTGRYPHSTGAPELHQALPAEQVMLTEPLRKAGYWTASAGKWHLGRAAIAKLDRVYQGGGPSGCEKWLKALRERPKDRPFFLWLAAIDPHRGYSKNAIEKPHTANDVVVPPYFPDTPEVRADLALYYDEIARLDRYLGAVLDELSEQGVAEDTFVVFLSDNGRPFPRCKTTLYDDGIRTPFIVRYPRRVKPGTTTRALVSTVDLAPTILELAGLDALPSFQGRSFTALLDDPGARVREYAFAEHNWHDYRAHERAVITERLTYIWNGTPEHPRTPPADAVRSPTYGVLKKLHAEKRLIPDQSHCFGAPRPEEELYARDRDPYSLRDLASELAWKPELERLRKALAEWQRKTEDRRPEVLSPDTFDRETGKRLKRKAG